MVAPEKRDKWPRHYAVDLTDAWVRGEPTAALLARLPENFRGLASAHARAFCEQIKFHRRVGTPLDQLKGSLLADWVRIYTQRLSAK